MVRMDAGYAHEKEVGTDMGDTLTRYHPDCHVGDA